MSERGKQAKAVAKAGTNSGGKSAAARKPKSADSSDKSSAASVARHLDAFIAKFDVQVAKRIRECRAILRKRFPTAIELVYDNYNFFVIGFAPTERPSTTFFSIAANAHGVGLSFYWGSTLPDPHKILQGSGSQNRFVRLPDSSALSDPKIIALLHDAVAQSKVPLGESKGYTVIKSVSAKQRPRRA